MDMSDSAIIGLNDVQNSNERIILQGEVKESGTPIFMTLGLRGFFYHKKRLCEAVHSIRLCVKSYSIWKFEILAIFYDLWYICTNVRIQTYTYNLYILIGFYVIQKHNKYISFE